MKSIEIRQAFLDYFERAEHTCVPSSSLVPAEDPTLLFTNAGMVPFKDLFLGNEQRGYTRAVSVQRCVRAGGKHNDLDNVGYTARHHTFFEMLGNFSFGDYFKREAINYAWKFLTEVLQLPAERLWVTVYEDDHETAAIWLEEMRIAPERFSRCGADDNFWSMGETGPCGPCTEIFYDHGSDIAGGPPGSPDSDLDRYIEIWNLVFMQFNRDKNGKLQPLPKPSVDTGMGLERIAAVVQGVHSNYETDLFQPLLDAILVLAPAVSRHHPSCHVIADHIRSCAFLIADGVLPGNEGRGYVLRRIIRRAIRHGNKLQLPTPFFASMVKPLLAIMGSAYPELATCAALIEKTLLQEEHQFERTLEQGLRLLQEYMQTAKNQEISGEVAFKLYDTYGFPLDLTADLAREHGLLVDLAGFDQCMQRQREQSQATSNFNVDYTVDVAIAGESVFHGYDKQVLTSQVVGILVADKATNEITSGQKAAVILHETPFYAESGGQVGDRGVLLGNNAMQFRVDDTRRHNKLILHYGELLAGILTVGEAVAAHIDVCRRNAIRRNHTATHLVHAALRAVLGSLVVQRGSLVDAERARFDFSYDKALTPDEMRAVENIVNEQIRLNTAVQTHSMTLQEAQRAGAMALFGEKYADAVRVLSVGDFSKELCGGTHVERTGDIGLFKIINEAGIASGIRRIEFVTGVHALDWVNQQITCLDEIAAILKTTVKQIPEKLMQRLTEAKQQEKELAKLRMSGAAESAVSLLTNVQQIRDINVLVKQCENLDISALRIMLDQLKAQLERAVIVLCSIHNDKLNVVAGISKAILGQVPTAVTLVRHLCGHGGGRDDMAQGGGVVPKDFHHRLAEIVTLL